MLIDVSMPITAGAMFRRGTPPVEIAARLFITRLKGSMKPSC